MVVLDFKKPLQIVRRNKPCIRIKVNDSSNITEYITLYKAAEANNITITEVTSCCDRNKDFGSLKYRIKEWYFIYKDE